jgi:hypothetical protein
MGLEDGEGISRWSVERMVVSGETTLPGPDAFPK